MTDARVTHEPARERERKLCLGFTAEVTCSCDELFSGQADTLYEARAIRDASYAVHLEAHPKTLPKRPGRPKNLFSRTQVGFRATE